MSLHSYIAKQFRDPAGTGGKLVSAVMNRQNRPLYEETIRLLSPSNSDSILDIGCGNGTVLNMLANQCNCDLTGIDTSMSILKDATKRNCTFVKKGKMTFLCQNANAMTFADQSFSKAYTINTVYFWESLGDTMAEIERVLKPGGLFINTLYTNETLHSFAHTQFGYKQFTTEQLVSAGADAGFIADVVPIQNGDAYCIIYRRS